MKNLISILFIGFIALTVISCKGKSGETTVAEQTTDTVLVSNAGNTSQIFHVIPAESRVYWEGYKPARNSTHTGTVSISNGTLTVKGGMIESGSFVIDMNTITDTDLQGQMKENLEAHLKGTAKGKEDDFFNVAKYPTGKFEITKVTALENDAEANTMIYGNLTLKDISKPIAFKANVNIANGKLTGITTLFKIDRTEWNIKVLSKKFFDNLKDGFVDDQFGLRIDLKAAAGKDM